MIEQLADLDPDTREQLRWSDDIPGFELDDSQSSKAPSQDLDEDLPGLETDSDDDDEQPRGTKRKATAPSQPKKSAKKDSTSKKKRRDDVESSDEEHYDDHWSFLKCLNRSLRPVAAVAPEDRVQVAPASLLPTLSFLPPVPALRDESAIEKVCSHAPIAGCVAHQHI